MAAWNSCFTELRKWNAERNEYCVVDGFTPLTIYADDVDLPYGVERMFQMLNFVDFSQPAYSRKIERIDDAFPRRHTWIMLRRFLSCGGRAGMPIIKHFRLDGTSKTILL